KLECRQEQRANGQYPDYTFSCTRGAKEIFRKKGYGADWISDSSDHKYIAGISNSGLHPFAFWVIDNDGTSIVEQPHGGIRAYCQQTITLVRVWFDAREPDISFHEIHGKLADVTVRGCGKGETLSLNQLSHFQRKLSADEEAAYQEQLKSWNVATINGLKDMDRRAGEYVQRTSEGNSLVTAPAKHDTPKANSPGAIIAAADNNQGEVVRLLLGQHANPNSRLKSGETALSLAAFHGYDEIVKLLLAANADPEIEEQRFGWTPVMRAANQGHLGTVKLLVAARADYRKRDKDGKSAADHARDNGHEDIVNYLASLPIAGTP
ncbi:MAG: ankyrin repeat domain-containing protein, partial [Bdellovibrionota bacterium]